MTNLETKVYSSIDAVNQSQWNNLVGNSDRGSLFQSYLWLSSLESTLDVEPRHIVVSKDGNPIGVLPNFLTNVPVASIQKLESLPFGSGGPVISSNESNVLPLLLDKVEQICSGFILRHEIISQKDGYMRYSKPLMNRGYKPQQTHCRFLIDLTQSWSEIKNSMSSERRNLIRKAIEQDFSVMREPLTTENLYSFHKDYKATMDRVNTSPYPLQFFQQLSIDISNRISLVRAYVKGELVGSHFYVEDGDRIIHLFSGIKEDYFEYYPSELIHRHVIKNHSKEKIKKYDFGSTAASFDNGLFKYKQSYGGRLVPNLHWEKPSSRTLSGVFKAGKFIYQYFND